MAEARKRKSNIYDDYPNIYLDLPSCTYCAYTVNKSDAELAFKKCCPRNAKITGIEHIQYSGESPVCHWQVSFALVDEHDEPQNLPESYEELDTFLTNLTLFVPVDCKVIKKTITTPKMATLLYQVHTCKCEVKNFEIGDIISHPTFYSPISVEACNNSLKFLRLQ